jgi:hypothetical protein
MLPSGSMLRYSHIMWSDEQSVPRRAPDLSFSPFISQECPKRGISRSSEWVIAER